MTSVGISGKIIHYSFGAATTTIRVIHLKVIVLKQFTEMLNIKRITDREDSSGIEIAISCFIYLDYDKNMFYITKFVIS